MALCIKTNYLFSHHMHTAQEHKYTYLTTNLLKHNIHKNARMKMCEYTSEYKLRTYAH